MTLCANEPDLWFSADPDSIAYAQHVCQARPTVPEYAAINAARRDRWNQGWTDEQIGATEGIAATAIGKWRWRRRNGLAARAVAA